MKERLDILLEPMKEAVELICLAMNPDEAQWAQKTMKYYFTFKTNGIDSGREYYTWRDNGQIRGLIGLHRYLWDLNRTSGFHGSPYIRRNRAAGREVH